LLKIHSSPRCWLSGVGCATYINCRDWVEICTAIVEHRNGRMEVIHWGGRGGVPQGERSLDRTDPSAASAPPRIAA
jgi:hypothetical protein